MAGKKSLTSITFFANYILRKHLISPAFRVGVTLLLGASLPALFRFATGSGAGFSFPTTHGPFNHG
jgi:hypothetical protein